MEFKARLSPPLEPLRPGGYDFARNLYFQGIGASGFVLGRIRTAEPPVLPGLRLRAAAMVDAMRDALDRRIRSVLAGDHGSIASALITGKRDAISAKVNDAMFISGLGHVLSISGYHMAVVAGLVFFVLRALFALMPAASGRYPIKKWAALAALAAAAFYLVLSGAEVATQRSFIMIAIVLVGVMVDRPAITLRTLTVAAILVLLLAPEAIVHPSFQMSFAATLALGRRLRARASLDDGGSRNAARRADRAMGRAGDPRADRRIVAGGLRDDAVRGLPLPSAGALWRAGKPPGDAGGVAVDHADGHSWRRSRCRSASTGSAGV